MTTNDVIKAIQEQNLQVAAGRIGQPPVPHGEAIPFDLPINTQGRLLDQEQFEKIIVKTGQHGQNVYLKDVVRKTTYDDHGNPIQRGIELGAKNYDVNSFLGTKDARFPAATLAVFQLPGSNAIATADAIKAKMKELQARFPAGRV